MAQTKHTRRHWTITTDFELYTIFKKLSADTRIPSSRLLDEAIEDLLLKYKVIDKKEKTP